MTWVSSLKKIIFLILWCDYHWTTNVPRMPKPGLGLVRECLVQILLHYLESQVDGQSSCTYNIHSYIHTWHTWHTYIIHTYIQHTYICQYNYICCVHVWVPVCMYSMYVHVRVFMFHSKILWRFLPLPSDRRQLDRWVKLYSDSCLDFYFHLTFQRRSCCCCCCCCFHSDYYYYYYYYYSNDANETYQVS